MSNSACFGPYQKLTFFTTSRSAAVPSAGELNPAWDDAARVTMMSENNRVTGGSAVGRAIAVSFTPRL